MLAALLLVACGQGEPSPSLPAEADLAPQPVQPEAALPAGDPPSWSSELAALDTKIEASQARFDKAPDNWMAADSTASLLRQRARLTGDYADYERAEALYEAAFAVAVEGTGPLLGRARLHFTLHRLADAEADLSLVEAGAIVPADTLRQVADLRADIELERGELRFAEDHWRQREQAAPTLSTAVGMARVAWLQADFATADAWFIKAADRYHGGPQEPVAWAHLQRGLLDLDQGDPAAALVHYQAADAALPGYWLVEEHMAEALVLTGKADEALDIYRDVVARTGSPELQGALAELLLERGEEAEAKALIDAASATYSARIARFPEAATGHALEHSLQWGGDPAAALAMAEQNAKLRPSGAAMALLSEARLAAGDPGGARKAAERGLSTGTVSAGLLMAAALASKAEGADGDAQRFLERARAIDPSSQL